MTSSGLESLIIGGETLDAEFKGEKRSPLNDRELVEAVVCLANRAGGEAGRLLIGDKAAYVRQRGFEPLQQDEMVLQFGERYGRITRREATEGCRISGPQAYRLLARLTEQGLLTREAERGHGVGYRKAAK
jgi:predicted HTH transcriptional regulator